MPFGILRCKTWNRVSIIILTMNYCAPDSYSRNVGTSWDGLFFFSLTEKDKQYFKIREILSLQL